jgi:hypothetical protein
LSYLLRPFTLQNFERVCREKGGGKEKDGSEVNVEPLGRVAIFLRSIEIP